MKEGPVADYEIPEDLRYTAEDEWIRSEGEEVVIGISHFAQDQLGDIVFVELPEVGATTEAGTPFGTIESVKAVSDLFAPLTGEVLGINEALEDQPELVNENCYGDGWLIRLKPTKPDELPTLLEKAAYIKTIEERESD
ncbi:MAG: glycine cleavage system protein GcvH [Myxococcota bacterium]